MGDLTAAQIAAIPTGKIGHKLEVFTTIAGTSWNLYHDENVVHDDTASPPVRAVTCWGSRANSVTNISPKQPGSIEITRQEITINNTNGKAHIGTVDSDGYFYFDYGAYEAMSAPSISRLKHSYYVWTGLAWSELPGSPWMGQIHEVHYDDIRGEATIIAQGLAAHILQEPWHVDHSVDSLVYNSHTPSAFSISDVTTGLTAGGNLWLQATSSVACAGAAPVARFRYGRTPPQVNTPAAAGSSTSTLHRFEDTAAPSPWGMPNCYISLTLTRTSDSRALTFHYPEIPLVNLHQSTVARPW